MTDKSGVKAKKTAESGGQAQDQSKILPLRAPVPCPECGKPSKREFYPFCSRACRSMDLNRWLSGRYIIPGPELDEEGE